MKKDTPWILWGTVLLVLAALVALRSVLLPFVAAFILAYLFHPPVTRLARLGMGRGVAAALMVGCLIILLVAVLLIAVPFIVQQTGALVERLPASLARLQALLVSSGLPLLERLRLSGHEQEIDTALRGAVAEATRLMRGLLVSVVSGGQAALAFLSLMVITPVVAVYLLIDWPRLIATLDDLLPRRYQATLRGLAREIDATMGAYLRGQGLLCLVLAAFYALSLSLLGLNFAVVIGLIAGLVSFIPYVGTLTGLGLSLGIGVAQFWPDWGMIGAILGVFIVGQFLEGYVFYPKLVGSSVGLHPVWLIFALVAFGTLLGFVGLLLAVPLAAALGVLTRFAVGRYRESQLYAGDQPAGGGRG